jgi:hypothetical protein
MKITKLGSVKHCIAALAVGLAVSQATVAAQAADAPERSIEGVWRVTVTPRNCVTGVPIPTAAFEALFTFHKGGTMSAWLQNSTITTTRSPNHGLWKRDAGWSAYSFKFVHLRYNLTTGVFIGTQEGAGTLVLGESGDEFTTDGSTASFDANGNPTGSSCSNSVGTRFKFDQ